MGILQISPVWFDHNSRHIPRPADSVQAGFQHREIPGHMVVHQCCPFVCFFQSAIQNNAAGNVGQFHDRSPNHQGNAVVNYTERKVPFTRIIEHKHFEMFGDDVYRCPKTVISREYSSEWHPGIEPFYTVNDERNNNLYKKYKELADQEQHVTFGGRLAEYKYYDMDQVIARAFEKWNHQQS